MISQRRSLKSSKPSRCESFQGQPAKKLRSSVPKTLTAPSSTEEEVQQCLVHIFSGMAQGFWWQVLPDMDNDNTICIGTGVPWEELLPLLVKSGLLKPCVRSTVSGYKFKKNNWSDIANAVADECGHRFQFTHAEYNGQKKTWFVCIGDPLHRSVVCQFREKVICKNLELATRER